MRFLALALLVAWPGPLMGQGVEEGDYRVASCGAYNFVEDAWDHLVRLEPRIEEHLGFIQKASNQGTGSIVKVTTCSVRWPVASDGSALPGLRTAVIDHAWNSIVNGTRVDHHVGMKIVWSERRTSGRNQLGHRVTSIKREMRGLLLCWGPDGCGEMGIPYPTKPTNDTPRALLIPRTSSKQ